MKRIIFLFAFIAILAACKQPEPEGPLQPEVGSYLGTVTVKNDDTFIKHENITVRFLPSVDGKTASLEIQKIKFVPAMPVTVDVTIPDVNLAVDTEQIYLYCDKVIPLTQGEAYPQYIVTGLTGRIIGEELAFSLKFGDTPTAFRGTLKL